MFRLYLNLIQIKTNGKEKFHCSLGLASSQAHAAGPVQHGLAPHLWNREGTHAWLSGSGPAVYAMPAVRLSGNGSASDTGVGEPRLEELGRLGPHRNSRPWWQVLAVVEWRWGGRTRGGQRGSWRRLGPSGGGSGVGGWLEIDVHVEAHAGRAELVMADQSGGHCGRSMGWGRTVRRGCRRGGNDGPGWWPAADGGCRRWGIRGGERSFVWREDSDSAVKLVRSVRWRWYGNGDERDALVVCEEEKVKCDLSSALGDSQGIMRPCGGTRGRGGKQQRD
jgi:hypothetical protein